MALIGIDLGTTNSTVSFRNEGDDSIHLFPIQQYTAQDTQSSLNSLPSFLYFPPDEEQRFIVGQYARERGSELPARLISSAKSWLSCGHLDRRSIALPLDGEEGLSPLETITAFLTHIKNAWNSHQNSSFAEQEILITVPASFDPSARQLVEEAAEAAGYPEITLLEEPQAAFYAWLEKQKESWREQLQVGDRVLVIDIGGGTTDFSLIDVKEKGGDLELERRAVGEHLLLGGDNFDLALAYTAKAKLEKEGHSIDSWQMRQLTHLCTAAKEAFLSENPPESYPLSIKGRGSKLIGGSIQTELTRPEVDQFLVDGFVPLIDKDNFPKSGSPTGLKSEGLPYAADPRISAHLAQFLANANTMPTKVLFNGGTLKASALQKRFMELLNQWTSVECLLGVDLDFAVSRGAVHYGAARKGEAIHIRAGAPKSYYIGVEEAIPAVPGIPTPLKAYCIVPQGMEEGTESTLEGCRFALTLGEMATFRFFSSSTQSEPIVSEWQELNELHPIETLLDKHEADSRTVSVQLKAKVSELGTLALYCVADDGREWKLEFDIRKEPELTPTDKK